MSSRSRCPSAGKNDRRAVTAGAANRGEGPERQGSDTACHALPDLLPDPYKRNGAAGPRRQGNKSLIRQAGKRNMRVHRRFANKSCPDNYWDGWHGEISKDAGKRLAVEPSNP